MKLKNKIGEHGKRCLSFMMAGLIGISTITQAFPAHLTAYAAETGIIHTNPDGTIPNGNKPQDLVDTARVYVGNTPIRLEVSKVKTDTGDHEGLAPKNTDADMEDTVTYKYSGRIDGTEADLIQKYGIDAIELAYNESNTYLGYGWLKGTLEILEKRKEHEAATGENVSIIYNEFGVFEGYAYITRKLETADNTNRYVAGATMSLYDAVEIYKNYNEYENFNSDKDKDPDYNRYGYDDKYQGLVVDRNANGDITSMYIKKGYAGSKVEYVLEKTDDSKVTDENGKLIDDNYNYQDEINDSGEGVWTAKIIQREDTPILYYNMNDLKVTTNDTYKTNGNSNKDEIDKVFGKYRFDKDNRTYGFNHEGAVIDITQKDETDFSIFAFKDGDVIPTFEIISPDYSQIKYSAISKSFYVPEGTTIYHLDQDGNRDAEVDPQIGMAYVTEDITEEEIQDCAKNTTELNSYHLAGRIYTWPVNIYKDGTGAETFEKIKTTRIATIDSDTENEYITGTYDGEKLIKKLNPTLDENGMPIYYQKSEETYVKGNDLYDRDGDYLGYAYTDKLDAENKNAYTVKNHENLYNGDNDDPFDQSTHYLYSSAQKIKVTIDLDSNRIVNGSSVIPTPTRDGKIFAGWLIDPNKLEEGTVVNAYWKTTGSMGQDQIDKWYSNGTPSGNLKTITVIFSANGGSFDHGSGDIHSADNKLYFRQGESFVIENTWVTGESTPNDPFDTQEVATIDQTDNTANDPYKKDAAAGGQVDVLKRIPFGTYIMEEIKAPEGYAKGFPVGISVKENTTVQTASMVDQTIKVDISKLDAPDDYTFNLYTDGELNADPAGNREVITEPKGSYSYDNVEGAILAIYADEDKDTYSQWISSTSGIDDANKRTSTEHGDYITFDSSAPFYLETLPEGNYTISEIHTPDGYVTADDMKITVTATNEPQVFIINDDHTKVEIKKYYTDEEGIRVMPNVSAAGLELKKGDKTVERWYTDDVKDYTSVITDEATKTETGFIHNYEQMVNEGNNDILTVSWKVERIATKKTGSTTEKETWIVSDGSKVVVENGEVADDAPEGFKEAYLSRNMDSELDKFTYQIEMSATKQSGPMTKQIWKTNTDKYIHICAYKTNEEQESGKQAYAFDYKFNYKSDFNDEYKNLKTYDTVDGIHRFDYIPAGEYTLEEFDVPEGFLKAPTQTIVVKETGDIQRFTMENKLRELTVTKVAQDNDNSYYAGIRNNEVMSGNSGIEIKGAELKLYKVDAFTDEIKNSLESGSVPVGATLIDEWITGESGTYTKEDEKKELIPSGYQVGDYKPHKIKNLDDGYYYIIETTTPDYYRASQAVEVVINNMTSEATVTNREMAGKISVHKSNKEGKGLQGAVFEIVNKTTGSTVGTIVTDTEGNGTLIIDDIGKFGKDGMLIPYTFTIKETNPPAGYQIDSQVHDFSFDGTDHTSDYAIAYNKEDAALIDGILYVTDTETNITISKKDYTNGMGVAGAGLVIYEARYNEGSRQWEASGEAIERWTTQANNDTKVITGLAGGKTYVLQEESVPDGYTKADDMFFRVADNGLKIDRIWYDAQANQVIDFVSDTTGAVESIHMSTRTVAGSYAIITNTNTGASFRLGTTNDGFTLTEEYLTDYDSYKMEEYIIYSDGTEKTISTTNFIARLQDGYMKVNPLHGVSVEDYILNSNGEIIASWTTDGTVKTIHNPLAIDKQGITVNGTKGKDHEGITINDTIVYHVNYNGKGQEITLRPDSNTLITNAQDWTKNEDGTYTYITEKEEGSIKFSAALIHSTDKIVQMVSIGDRNYYYMNPVSIKSSDPIFKNTSKIVLYNDVIGNDPRNELASFTYRITLTDANGNPLNGSYDYRTKANDTSRDFEAFGKNKEFEITLSGSDFLVIDDLPYNTRYSIKLLTTDDFNFAVVSKNSSGTTAREDVANVYFSNTRNISSDRTLFEKNETYEVVERTALSNKTIFESAKYGFSLGENCELISFELKNKGTQIEITKKDITSDEELPGATLTITDESGNIVEQWVSTDQPHVIYGTLQPGKTYTLTETISPDGFGYSNSITFTVSMDGSVDKVLMVDDETSVSISKKDITGNAELPNATLTILDEAGNVVKDENGNDLTWISTDKPHIIKGTLVAGKTYVLREVAAPDGYAYSTDVSFTISTDGQVDIVEMHDDFTRVMIMKYSINGDAVEPLENAKLQILDKDKKPVLAIRDSGDFKEGMPLVFNSKAAGVDITGLLNADTLYYLRELEAPTGYIYSDDVPFTVNHDGSVLKVDMFDAPIKLSFLKTDESGIALPGATIKIYDDTNKLITGWISGMQPQEVGYKLDAGKTYRMTEEIAPDGYYFFSEKHFTIAKDGIITFNGEIASENILIEDKPTIVTFTKIDITGEKELPGATITILDKDGNIVKDRDGNPLTWISGDTQHIITGIFNAGETYYMHEEQSPDGYGYSEDIEFTVDKNGIPSSVTMSDIPTKAVISKISTTTGKELPGAHLQVIDKDSAIIDAWVSTGKPHEITGKLIAGETYTLVETACPDGYAYTESVEFTVPKENGKTIQVKMEDKPTHVTISKIDITNSEELPGAELVLTDSNGNEVERWISGTKPHEIIAKLIAGETYTLSEYKAPDGYGYSENITFTVSNDGSIDKVIMKDKPTEEVFSKMDITGEKELPGARMQVIDQYGTVVEAWISTETPHKIIGKLIAGETYILHEESAPSGYAYSEDIRFTVPKDGKVQEVKMKDKPTHVELTKTDITGEKEIPGAHIQIKDKNGNVVDEWISEDVPHVIIGKLEAGEEYYMHEEKAPDGYGYTEDIKFTVSKDGSIDKVTMKDDTLKLRIIKWDETKGDNSANTDKMLGGAKLQIKDDTGKVVDEWMTEKGKYHEIEEVFPSTGIPIIADAVYTLVEVEAPDGYRKSGNITFTASKNGEVRIVDMVDTKPGKPWEPETPDTPDDKPTPITAVITITKYDAANLTSKVAGAEYTIYNQDGSVYQVVVTDENGEATIARPADGTYTFKETKAPAGYMIDLTVHTFTVSDGVVNGNLNVSDYPKKEVVITKLDESTKEPLPGAVFEVYNSNGKFIGEYVTGIDGKFSFYPEYDDTYTIVETKAPDGYELDKVYIKVTVKDGVISGERTVYNSKEHKVGRITAYYDNGVTGHGNAYIGEDGKIHIDKLGDSFNMTLLVTVAFITLGGILVIITKKRRRKHDKK